MHRDPALFPDPDVFRPERYLNDAGQLKPALPDTHGYGHLSYGFGKRYALDPNMITLYATLTERQDLPRHAFCGTETIHRDCNHVMGV